MGMSDTQGPVRKGLDWAQARVLTPVLDDDAEDFYKLEKADCDG
jgi:hypothetical protein